MNNKGSIALITGATGGIGLAIVKRLAQHCAVLIINSRDKEALQKIEQQCNSIGAVIIPLAFDVSDASAVKKAFAYIFKHYKRLDILVNCAGIMPQQALMTTSPETLQQIFSVNTFGSFYCAQYASRLMAREQRGVIINISSVVAQQGAAGLVAYAASKSALKGLTASMAKELGSQGIRVNSVAPGFIETDLVAHYSAEQRHQLANKTALGRLGSADDVAALVEFLVSDGASYLSGQTLTVDGGIQL